MQKIKSIIAECGKADNSLPGSYFKELLLVAFDGSTLALQDTPANSKEFGRSSNQNGEAAWPLARFVGLAECGTHLVFAAKLGGYRDSEMILAHYLVRKMMAQAAVDRRRDPDELSYEGCIEIIKSTQTTVMII